MSRRAKQRQRGWIEFKGLQFAEPFMTRDELVKYIHCFFEERGLNLTSRTSPLPIRFCRERNPRTVEDGVEMSIAGLHRNSWNPDAERPLGTKEIIVYVRRHASREKFVNTLFHELDHCVWALEGRTLDNSEKYWHRPHEVRARQVGSEWSKRLSR